MIVSEAKKVIEQRFECLQASFRQKFGHELKGSPEESCFYYPEHLPAILAWNSVAQSDDDLIDLAGYNQHTIGDLGDADVIFLGNNPGSAGVFSDDPAKQAKEMAKIRESVKYLPLPGGFYPLANANLMRFMPWFPNRLRRPDSLLGPFLRVNPDICRFAPCFASAELSPYHTRYFTNSGLQLLSQKKNDAVNEKVRAAMRRGAILIAMYVGAKDRWIERIPELENCDNFYFCHNPPRTNPRFSTELERLSVPGRSAYGEVIARFEKRFRARGLI